MALAAAPAQPEALPSNALSTDLGRHCAEQSAAASPTTSTLHPHFVPSSSSLNGDDDDGTTRDHTARPGSPTSSQSSFSSSLSSDDYLPTLRTFQRLHLVQFALTLLLLFVLPVVIVVVLAHQLRWEAFLLGVASWLASEQLREVVFELFTPSGSSGAPALEEGDFDAVEVAIEEPLPPVSPSARPHGVSAVHLALPTVVHALAQEALRLGAVALVVKLLPSATSSASLTSSSASPPATALHPPHDRPPLPPLDPLFWSALWLALGSAMTEILWGSRRLWKQLELYGDVLPRDGDGEMDEEGVLRGVDRRSRDGPYEDDDDEGEFGDGTAEEEQEYSVVECFAGAGRSEGGYGRGDDDDEAAFQRRLRAVQRDELEAQLGVPLPAVPVGVVFIWRLDRYALPPPPSSLLPSQPSSQSTPDNPTHPPTGHSILLSLIFTLLLSLPFRLTPPSLFPFPLVPTFAFASLTHAALAYGWVATVKQWGIPSVSFASLVALVGMLFATLGAWGVLV